MEQLDYLQSIAKELAIIAAKDKHQHLALLFEMAALEAKECAAQLRSRQHRAA